MVIVGHGGWSVWKNSFSKSNFATMELKYLFYLDDCCKIVKRQKLKVSRCSYNLEEQVARYKTISLKEQNESGTLEKMHPSRFKTRTNYIVAGSCFTK